MKIADILDFTPATDSIHRAAPAVAADPEDVRLLIGQFLECNRQYMARLVTPLAAERFCNDTIMNHLAEQGLREEADYEAYVTSLLGLLAECRAHHQYVAGLNPRNAHVIDRMITRLQLELLPTPEINARLLRSVMTHTGMPYKLEEFIAMSQGSAYVRWHWGDMIAMAEAKGGHSLRIAQRLQQAVDTLEDNAAPAEEVDVMALAMGQF